MKRILLLALAVILAISGCVQQNTSGKTSSTTTTITETTSAQTSLVSSSTFSSSTTTTLQDALISVHEWGVLSGGSIDASYNLLSAPDTTDLPVVKEPVIYVHSENGGTFDAGVVFKSGRPTKSYPVGETNSDSIQWNGVKILPDAGAVSYPSEILRTINDVDADVLQYQEHRARSLFYEGTVSYENAIRLIYNADRKQALIENKGSYPVYDLLLIVPTNYNKLLGKYIYADILPKVGPGETVTVALKQAPAKVDYAQDLVGLGYTRKEAEAFAGIWEQEFQKVEKGNGKLVYRISQEEYDGMIALKIKPEPVKTIRSLYIMVLLTGKDTPQLPVIGSGLGIYQGQNLLLSEDQMVSYNQTSHVIKLTEDGLRAMRSKVLYEEVNGELVPELDGLYLKTFSVRLDGQELYSGTFWSSASSESNKGLVLLDVLSILSDDHITIAAGYPGPANYKGVDPRNNTKLMQYLKEKNKLVE